MITKHHLFMFMVLYVFCGISYDEIEVKQFENGSVTISKRDGGVLWSREGDVSLYSLILRDFYDTRDKGKSVYIQHGAVYFVYAEKEGDKDFLCKIDARGAAETQLPGPRSARFTVQFKEMADGKFACIRDYRLQQFNLCVIDADSLSIEREYQGSKFMLSENLKNIAYICDTAGAYSLWNNVVINGIWIYPMKNIGYTNYEQLRSFGWDDMGPYFPKDGKNIYDLPDRCKICVVSPLIWTKTHEGLEGVSFLARYGLTGEVRAVFAYLDEKKEPHALESQTIETRKPFLQNVQWIGGYDEPDDLTLYEIESWKGNSLTYKPFVSDLNKTSVESRTVELQWSKNEN